MKKYLLKALIIITALALFCTGGYYLLTATDFARDITNKLFGSDEPYSYGVTNGADVEVTLTNFDEQNVSEELQARIKSYFERYSATLTGSGEESLYPFFAYQCEDYLTDRLTMNYEAERFYLNRLEPQRITSEIVCKRAVSPSDSLVELEMTQSFCCYFGETAAKTSGISHRFSYKKNGTEWEIFAHEWESDIHSYALSALEKEIEKDGYIRSDLTYSYIEKYADRANELLIDEIKGFKDGGEPKEIPQTEYVYLRDAAVNYARTWSDSAAGGRNTAYFGSYDINTANFTSQCLIAGGIPMDVQGAPEVQWKWYSDFEIDAQSHSGYSKSFISGSGFYSYCLENKGFGLVSLCDVPISMAEKGDIIQLLDENGEYLSQCIITSTENGIFIAMNDTDRTDFPLMALPFSGLRVIKVVGYNTVNLGE